MPAVQLVLTGVPAFVYVVRGATTVRFSIDENVFDPNRMVDVDLAKNTSLPAASWATGVDVDLQTAGGFTTVGPRFPRGVHNGGVYLAQRLVTQYSALLASWPPAPDALYQYQAVLRSDNGNITRYHGFKVRKRGAAQGTLVHLAFYRAGDATPGSLGSDWIDLADPDISDPQANGFTTITPASPAGTDGALFLTSSAMAALAKPPPKWPPSQGW